jgi:hypothetical protein
MSLAISQPVSLQHGLGRRAKELEVRPIRPSDPRSPEPSIIMDQAVLRGTARHPVRLVDQVLSGPGAGFLRAEDVRRADARLPALEV